MLEPTLTQARPAVLEVVFTAPAKPGTHRERLTITTGYSARPRVSLPVTLCVSDSVTITPDRLDFGRLTRGQAVSGKTGTGSSEAQRRRACTRFSAVSRTLTITTGPDTKLRSVTARPEVLKIDLGLPDDQGTIPARLTLKPDAPYGPLAGEVRLELAGPRAHTLSVPFTSCVAEEEIAE